MMELSFVGKKGLDAYDSQMDYWLNPLHDNGYLNEEQYKSLKIDIDRILKILSSIVKTMKEKILKKYFIRHPLFIFVNKSIL